MKKFKLSKNGSLKISKGKKELYFSDFEDSLKSGTPGEWCYFLNSKTNQKFIGYVNPLVDNSTACAHSIKPVEGEIDSIEKFLEEHIDKSISRRMLFDDYTSSARLIFGSQDDLPGLTVDSYENYVIIQINTAGMDRYRKHIQSYFTNKYQNKKVTLLDNEKYREREQLPMFSKESISEDLSIVENQLKITVKKNVVQKIGYYYDHRENRLKAKKLIERFQGQKSNACDLFCYVGSWGLNLIDAGCEHIDFVDQGNFEESITLNLKNNNMEDKGSYHRGDVFKFLKEAKVSGKLYDVVCSDPPAFAKSKNEERRAYDGYSKLHKACFDVLRPGGILLASSCTHYVDFSAFQKNIEEVALRTRRKIHLLECGSQGYDHPFSNLNSSSCYLKYFAYIVE